MFASRGRRIGLVIAFAAIGVAAAFLALGSDDGSSSAALAADRYKHAAGGFCLVAKHEIAQARRKNQNSADPRPLAQSLVHTTGVMRAQVVALHPPPDLVVPAFTMSKAMLQSEFVLLKLAQLSTLSEPALHTSAKRTEAVSTEIKEAASALGIHQCAHLALGISVG